MRTIEDEEKKRGWNSRFRQTSNPIPGTFPLGRILLRIPDRGRMG